MVVLPILCLASAPAAQTPLVAVGDSLTGETVTGVQPAAAEGPGTWAAGVELAGPSAGLVRDGVLVLKSGDALVGPAGVVFDALAWPAMGTGGELTWSGLVGAPWAMGPLSALVFEATVVRMQGDPCGAPGVGPGTTYASFDLPDVNASRSVLVSGQIDDPAVPGYGEAALMRFDLYAGGAVMAEAVLVKEGDALAGGTVAELDTLGGSSLNDAGDVFHWARLTGPDKEILRLNDTVLAETGGATPVPGLTWTRLDLGLSLGSGGSHAYAGAYAGGVGEEHLLVKDGAKLAQTGDALPDLAPFQLDTVEPQGLCLAADGTLAWVGTWNDPAGGQGVFLDTDLALRFGVTQIGPAVVDGLAGPLRRTPTGELSLALDLSDGTRAAYLLATDGALTPLAGCFGNPGQLSITGPTSSAGGTLSLALDQGQAPGVFPFLAWSTLPAPPLLTGPCGLMLPGFGELMIGLSPPNPALIQGGAAPWTGTPFGFQVLLPPSLYGATLYAQGLFVDLTGAVPAEPVRPTTGLELVIGL